MRPPHPVPTPADYVRLVLRGWVLVVAVTVLSAGAGLAVWATGDTTYSSRFDLFAIVDGPSNPRAATQNDLGARARIPTYADLATSPEVAAKANELLGGSAPDLAAHVTATQRLDSALLTIDVDADNPADAERRATAVAGALVAVTRQLENNDELGPQAQVTPVGSAYPAVEVHTSLVRDVGLAAAVGFIWAVIGVIALGLLSDRVLLRRHVDEVVAQVRAGVPGRTS
ncbi:YveK family protein [Williamsia sp. SKLECPSW1]